MKQNGMGENVLANTLCRVNIKMLYSEGRFEWKFGGGGRDEDMRARVFYTEEAISAKARGRMSLIVGKREREQEGLKWWRRSVVVMLVLLRPAVTKKGLVGQGEGFVF